jgi:hypothetical protein
LGEPQSRFELYEEEKNILTLLGIESRIFGCPPRSLVATSTDLSRVIWCYGSETLKVFLSYLSAYRETRLSELWIQFRGLYWISRCTHLEA